MKRLLGLIVACLFFGLMQASANEEKKCADQQFRICSTFQRLLALREAGHAQHNFEVYGEETGGGDTSYSNLDIDGDGLVDKVIRSCGAGLDALCFLFIDLSAGGNLELEERPFFLARLNSSTYVVVGEHLPVKGKPKPNKRSVYKITKENIKLICPSI